MYLCCKIEDIFDEFDCSEFIGLSYNELLKKFDKIDGWQVQFLPLGELILTHRSDELCLIHKE